MRHVREGWKGVLERPPEEITQTDRPFASNSPGLGKCKLSHAHITRNYTRKTDPEHRGTADRYLSLRWSTFDRGGSQVPSSGEHEVHSHWPSNDSTE